MNYAGAKPSVLCVDDEAGVVRSLRWLLQEEFHVETACDVREALELVRRHQFQVVISDQRMPDMTGTEFLSQVRRLQPQAMRLLLTGYSDYQAVLDSINQSEAYRFINKPWDNAELLRIVAEAASISLSTRPPVSGSEPFDARESTVLVLDSDPGSVPLIKGVLGASFQVLWARTVADATRLLTDRPVSVIVCESSVGGISTLPLINALKEQCPEIVVIVHTAERDARAVRRLLNEGQVFRFLTKPSPVTQLAAMLQLAVGKHRELLLDPRQQRKYRVDALSGLHGDGEGHPGHAWQPYAARMRQRYSQPQ
jgi:serine/threonine-protein kinase